MKIKHLLFFPHCRAFLRTPSTRTGAGDRALFLAWLCLAIVACGKNPATGKRQLALISEPQEIEIGRAAAQEAAQSLGLVTDEELQAYIHRLGMALASRSERPDLPWSFRVVDDPTPNAFALPGGFIFVTRGLLGLLTSEAELASVLGHEIGHVTARHSVNQISKAQLAQLGLGLGAALFPDLQRLGSLASAGLNLLFLKYGRDAERQADELGFRYALEQNYDVSEMADVFAVLLRATSSDSRSALPGWLASHPAEPERIAAVERRVSKLQQEQRGSRLGSAEFLEHIDGLVFGEDPRNGFFRDGVFYHPKLRFRFTVPTGWETQNLASAVTAVSPQRDAALQLTLAGEIAPEDAATRFLSQTASGGQGTSQRINGLSAVTSSFEAQSEQGSMRGIAAFVAHAGTTFQLVAYAPAAAFSRHVRDFEQTIGSFAPLDERSMLKVERQRIDVVRLPASQSLSEFSRRQPNGASLQQLALINQIEKPEAILPGGTLIKTIVSGDSQGASKLR